jgi:hypothetical protein
MRTKELDQIAEQMELERQKPTLLKGLWGIVKWLGVNGFRGIKRVVISNNNGLKASFGFVGVVSLFSILLMTLGDLGVNLYSLGGSGLIFLFSIVLGATQKKEESIIEYDINDEDWLDLYDLMGFKEDFESGQQFPYLLDIIENGKEIIYLFKANRNKVAQFQKHIDLLEEATNLELIEVRKNNKNKGLIEVVFLNKDYTVDRLDIEDIAVEENKDDIIQVSQDIAWNFRKFPHMLINGGTGGGKTFFIFYVIKILAELKADIKILDPKHSDLTKLKNCFGSKNVVYKHEEIAKTLINTVKDMYKRAEEIEGKEDLGLGTDYKDYGYKPVFIIFDEMMSFMRGGIDDKIKKEANKALLDIVAMGRQLGYFAIVAMQRGSTKSIDGDVRSQFHFRCTLGKMDNDGYKMAFGDNYKLKRTLKEKGSGFIQIEGLDSLEEPQEFYTPYIAKGYNLLEEIAKITKVEDQENVINLSKSDKVIQGNFQNQEKKKVTFADLQKKKMDKINDTKG